jgi:hypothetical protein
MIQKRQNSNEKVTSLNKVKSQKSTLNLPKKPQNRQIIIKRHHKSSINR